MKTIKTPMLVTAGSTALLLAYTTAASGHSGDEHSHEHHAESVSIAELSPQDSIQRLQGIEQQLIIAVTEKDQDKIHDLSDSLAQGATSLSTKVPPERRARVEGAVNNVKKAANSLHEAADQDNWAQSEAWVLKLKGAMQVLAAQITG